MKTVKFNEGEWCFCEFELQMVMETEDGRITGVSDGWFRLGSMDLSDRCFPMNIEIKRISDSVAHWSRTFHDLKCNALNHPDLNRELIRRWVELCENADDDKVRKALYEKLDHFGKSVVARVRELSNEEVGGVGLFRSKL